jgi:hypothetical protein
MIGKAQKSHGARSELNSLFGLKKNGSVEPHQNIRHTVQISTPRDLCAFPTMKSELRGKKFRSDQRSAARGWSVVRSASFAKGGTSKNRPSPHLHKVPTRSNKVSPRTFQTALVYSFHCVFFVSFLLFSFTFLVSFYYLFLTFLSSVCLSFPFLAVPLCYLIYLFLSFFKCLSAIPTAVYKPMYLGALFTPVQQKRLQKQVSFQS